MTNDRGQVFGFTEIEWLRKEVDKAKKKYLKHLISLGYVFQQEGSYESTCYWAIHPDYYMTTEEKWAKEDATGEDIWEGTSFPEYYPEGAFIVITSLCVRDSSDYNISSWFLDEDRCSIEYLREL